MRMHIQSTSRNSAWHFIVCNICITTFNLFYFRFLFFIPCVQSKFNLNCEDIMLVSCFFFFHSCHATSLSRFRNGSNTNNIPANPYVFLSIFWWRHYAFYPESQSVHTLVHGVTAQLLWRHCSRSCIHIQIIMGNSIQFASFRMLERTTFCWLETTEAAVGHSLFVSKYMFFLLLLFAQCSLPVVSLLKASFLFHISCFYALQERRIQIGWASTRTISPLLIKIKMRKYRLVFYSTPLLPDIYM